MQYDSSDPIDPSGLFYRIWHTLGRVEARLDSGQEFHREVRNKLDDHDHRLTVIESKPEGRSEFVSTVLEWIEVLKLLGPFLFLLTVIASAVGIALPEWMHAITAYWKAD